MLLRCLQRFVNTKDVIRGYVRKTGCAKWDLVCILDQLTTDANGMENMPARVKTPKMRPQLLRLYGHP